MQHQRHLRRQRRTQQVQPFQCHSVLVSFAFDIQIDFQRFRSVLSTLNDLIRSYIVIDLEISNLIGLEFGFETTELNHNIRLVYSNDKIAFISVEEDEIMFKCRYFCKRLRFSRYICRT